MSLPTSDQAEDQQRERNGPQHPLNSTRRMASGRAAQASPISPRSHTYPPRPDTVDPFADFDGTYVNARGKFIENRTFGNPDIRAPQPQSSRRPAFNPNSNNASTRGGRSASDSNSDENESMNVPPLVPPTHNAYEMLGVTIDSSHKEVKNAYSKLAKKFHPDKNKAHNAKEIFQRVQDAWEALRTKESRDAYDTAQTIAAGFGRASPKTKVRKVTTQRHFPTCSICSRSLCNVYHRWFTREGYVQQMSLTMRREYAESTAAIDYEPQVKDALGRNLCVGCGKAICEEPHRLFTKEGYLCYLLSDPNNIRGNTSQEIQAQLDEAFPIPGPSQPRRGIRSRSSSQRGDPAQFDGTASEFTGSLGRGAGNPPLGSAPPTRSFSFREFLRRGSRDGDRPTPKRTGSFSSLFKKS